MNKEIAYRRLANQLLTQPASSVVDAVRRLTMIQAQDYLGALWALSLRSSATSEAEVEQALAERTIVRSWPARGTLHFVAAEDLRWMLDLMASRTIGGRASRYRQLELTESDFARSSDCLGKELSGGPLTRGEIFQRLERAGIRTAGQRGIHILQRLALVGQICFGPRQGKQHTFVLLEQWIPQSKSLAREEALAELARRYFTSHGPATERDFSWWSRLGLGDVRAGIAAAGRDLKRVEIEGQTYWQGSGESRLESEQPGAFLLPAFDEYLVAYQNRDAVLDPQYNHSAYPTGGMLSPAIAVNGEVRGTWKRTLRKDSVVIEPAWFTAPDKADLQALEAAVEPYGHFLALRPVIKS